MRAAAAVRRGRDGMAAEGADGIVSGNEFSGSTLWTGAVFMSDSFGDRAHRCAHVGGEWRAKGPVSTSASRCAWWPSAGHGCRAVGRGAAGDCRRGLWCACQRWLSSMLSDAEAVRSVDQPAALALCGAADGCCRHTIVKEKGLPACTTSFATMLPTQRVRNQFHGGWLSRTESLFGLCNSTTVVVPTAGWVARGKRHCRYDTWAPRWSHGRAWSPHLAAPRIWDVATLWLAVLSSVTLPAPTAVGGRRCGALNASALPLETSYS